MIYIAFKHIFTITISQGDKKNPKQHFAILFLIATDLNV